MPNPNHTVIVDDMDVEQRWRALWYVINDGKIGKVCRGKGRLESNLARRKRTSEKRKLSNKS